MTTLHWRAQVAPCNASLVCFFLEFWQKALLGGSHPYSAGAFLRSSYLSWQFGFHLYLPTFLVHISIQVVFWLFIGGACAFCWVKNQCLGFWIRNGTGECYCCSCFLCTQMGGRDGREWKRRLRRSHSAKWSYVLHRVKKLELNSHLEQPHKIQRDLWPVMLNYGTKSNFRSTKTLFFSRKMLLKLGSGVAYVWLFCISKNIGTAFFVQSVYGIYTICFWIVYWYIRYSAMPSHFTKCWRAGKMLGRNHKYYRYFCSHCDVIY